MVTPDRSTTRAADGAVGDDRAQDRERAAVSGTDQGGGDPGDAGGGLRSLSARILDGAALGEDDPRRGRGRSGGARRRRDHAGLAVVLVGEDPASAVYVALQGEGHATRPGCTRRRSACRPTISEAELLAIVDRLNADPTIHGILVQLPLPKHIDSEKVLRRIDPDKDVDGFHPVNVGKLVIGDQDGLPSGTPSGVQQMLIRSGVETKGAHAVIVGRSNIVGKPMATLLIQQGPGGDATVTVCHSRTRDLPAVTRQRRHPHRGDREGRVRHRRHGPAGRGGDRRRDQPGGRRLAAQGLPPRRRRRVRPGVRRSRPRSRRCRAASAR